MTQALTQPTSAPATLEAVHAAFAECLAHGVGSGGARIIVRISSHDPDHVRVRLVDMTCPVDGETWVLPSKGQVAS